jgi:mannose-6-phosphate isomerase-like protein (cupin superfamily)
MKPLALALLFAGFAVSAGDPAGFHLWKSAELKAYSKSLSPKISDKKVASENIAAFGNYNFMIAHREGTGEAEFHATQADILVVQTGAASIIIGGEMVDGKTTAPNEIRAASIKGGEEKKLAAGDIITIPAKVAHQVRMDTSKEFTYFVIKVTQ